MVVKYAVYIVSGETGEQNLFAVTVSAYVTEMRELANQEIYKNVGSSDWVSVQYWNNEFKN